jgi:tRNA pseudouridine38-40 synthase
VARFKLSIEYVGTRYSGWQIQQNARTVQGELKEAILKASRQRTFELYGSGRTDAGVHALLQIAHLEIETKLPPADLAWAINDFLPSDIHVISVEAAPHRFHARHGAVGRSYLYQISRRRTAFAKPFVWWVKDELDAARMGRAALLLAGRHDFQSFTAADADETSTDVQIDGVELKEDGDLILIRIQGSHFLWKMVRRIVGILVEVGRGRMKPDDVASLLKSPSNRPAEFTAPPSGLFLERVLYEGDPREAPLLPAFSVGRRVEPSPRRPSR